MDSTRPRSWLFSCAFVCESRCNCSVFSFLLMRHLAAATLFFSSDAFRFASAGSLVWSCAAVDLLRPPVFFCLGPLLSSGGVTGFLLCVLPRLRLAGGCPAITLANRSWLFLDGSLVAELDLGGVTCP